ncbi:MAG: aminopeptidase P family N-terminal domain-containing protein, partial [Anaerolineales bacterium]|nr:aminopeptidase P family N-terminal domain-containing protein [Anaerolineales bacterium]
MIHSIRIPRSEFDERKAVLLNYVRERHLRGAVIFDSTNILYYSGFAFIPTERPIIYVLSASGEQAMFVPRLELEHVKAETGVDRVGHYREYPGVPRPEVAFKEMLAEMKMLGGEGEIGADMDGYP